MSYQHMLSVAASVAGAPSQTAAVVYPGVGPDTDVQGR